MSYTCIAKLVSLVSIILSLFSLRVAFFMVLSPFGLVHFDVWESISVVSNKFHFFCDICGWFFSYDMVIFYFPNFLNAIKIQFAKKIHILRFDNAKEYAPGFLVPSAEEFLEFLPAGSMSKD
jgi:hypothetical protein